MNGFLDIKRLRYFRAIAEQGSLSGAARVLNVAQPALTHHVNALESQLGVPLLRRRHDGVAVTDAGRLLLHHAIEIVARVDAAETELSRLGSRNAPTRLRLAAISSLAADLAPILLEAVRRQMPGTVLRITEAPTLDARALLGRGEADFAVSLEGEAAETPLALERLYFAGPGETNGRQPPIRFSELAGERLILPALGNPLRAFIESAAADASVSLNVVLEIDGAEPRRNAILAGLGASVFGGHSVLGLSRQAGLAVRSIIEPSLVRPIYFGARRGLDAALVAGVRALLGQALADFGGMEPSGAVSAHRDAPSRGGSLIQADE